MTNHELAERYVRKSILLGNSIGIKYNKLDGVEVTEIHTDGDGEYIVTEFITDIRSGSFKGKHYRSIVINNSKYRWFDASELCAGMSSKQLKVRFKNPKMVRNMSRMFSGCSELEELDIRNVVDMSGLFSYCNNLRYIDLSSFNTKKVKDMSEMFKYCKVLKHIDVNRLDTSRVKDTSEMFNHCESLNSLYLEHFNKSK